eukprot:TRINITY_DN19836_c1_g3_i1.p1 TRINITY_DN19836_c1_g3~~TRINITY_DN19836_c1_g3_i1.p1  ORF type:complete len:875 (-),score=303.73 TRINITY_DN19836_c1_g3_i1:1950-4574(-)
MSSDVVGWLEELDGRMRSVESKTREVEPTVRSLGLLDSRLEALQLSEARLEKDLGRSLAAVREDARHDATKLVESRLEPITSLQREQSSTLEDLAEALESQRQDVEREREAAAMMLETYRKNVLAEALSLVTPRVAEQVKGQLKEIKASSAELLKEQTDRIRSKMEKPLQESAELGRQAFEATRSLERQLEELRQRLEAAGCDTARSLRSLGGEVAKMDSRVLDLRLQLESSVADARDEARAEARKLLLPASAASSSPPGGSKLTGAASSLGTNGHAAARMAEDFEELRHRVAGVARETEVRLSEAVKEMNRQLTRQAKESDGAAQDWQGALETELLEQRRKLGELCKTMEAQRQQLEREQEKAEKASGELRRSLDTQQESLQGLLAELADVAKLRSKEAARLDSVEKSLGSVSRRSGDDSSRQEQRTVAAAQKRLERKVAELQTQLESVRGDTASSLEALGQEVSKRRDQLEGPLGRAVSSLQTLSGEVAELKRLDSVSSQTAADVHALSEKVAKLSARMERASGDETSSSRGVRAELSTQLSKLETKLEAKVEAQASEAASGLDALTAEVERLCSKSTAGLQELTAEVDQLRSKDPREHLSLLERKQASLNEVFEKVIPSLGHLHEALEEERAARQGDVRELGRRLEELLEDEQIHRDVMRNCTEATGKHVSEGLQKCEDLVKAAERRLLDDLTALKDIMDKRLRATVTREVEHNEQQLESLHRRMDGWHRLDKLERSLEATAPAAPSSSFCSPSPAQAANTSAIAAAPSRLAGEVSLVATMSERRPPQLQHRQSASVVAGRPARHSLRHGRGGDDASLLAESQDLRRVEMRRARSSVDFRRGQQAVAAAQTAVQAAAAAAEAAAAASVAAG